MRKIFLMLALALAFTTSTTAAQDVWISTNGDGSEWYLQDETIEGEAGGKFKWTNVTAKLVKANDVQIVRWNFTQASPEERRLANWVYDIDWGDGKRYTAEVLAGTNAEKILLFCLNHLGM